MPSILSSLSSLTQQFNYKQAKWWHGYLSIESILISNEHKERYSNPPIISEIETSITIVYHFIHASIWG